jgi:glycosyltransferase involved in cell wall biosynthesis
MIPEAFHSTRSSSADRPRLLFISYYFPPRQSAGALRWRKMAPFLHELGWDIDVLTTPPLGQRSPGGLSDLPEGVEMYAVPESPGRLRRLEDGIAAWIHRSRNGSTPRESSVRNDAKANVPTIPLSSVTWIPRSSREFVRLYKVLVDHEELLAWARSAQRIGAALAARNTYSAIVASGPPWSTTIAATRLGREYSLPVVLDFRDPWALPLPRHIEKTAHPLGALLGSRMEADVVRTARAVIVNTPTVERAMRERYPGVLFRTIANGVDDFFEPRPPKPGELFRIIYAGTIYLDRDPSVLFGAVGTMVRRLGLSPAEVAVEFFGDVGSFHRVPTERYAEMAGVRDYFRTVGHVPREELLTHLERASVLVSLPQSTPWSIPSKIFEYMGFNASLLVYAEPGSATAEMLAGSDATVLDPADRDGTVAALCAAYARHAAGMAASQGGDRLRFARNNRGKELQDFLGEIGIAVPRATPGT